MSRNLTNPKTSVQYFPVSSQGVHNLNHAAARSEITNNGNLKIIY